MLCVRENTRATSYTLIDSGESSTDTQRGKVLLVSFRATSCLSCVAEMPQILATHEKHKTRGNQTVAVAMNFDQPLCVVRFAQLRVDFRRGL